MTATTFSCRCGTVTGTLSDIDPAEGTHVVCHCNACRRSLELVGLDAEAADGVDLFQTTPDRIRIETGLDRLEPRRLSPKGILRWHATCCDTPMFNTMAGPGMPFVGVLVRNLADPAQLGPVIAHGFVAGSDGKQHHQNGAAVIWRLLKRSALARLSGRGRRNPFFSDDGKPIAEPVLLAKEA